jgi:Flp pilus assembly protein TadB
VSKERARRRAEREAAAAAERARRARVSARRARGQAFRSALARPFTAARGRGVDSALRRHRQRQNGVVLAVVVGAHVAYWLFEPSWTWRLSALVLTVALWPVLLVVLFDRRSTR